MDGRDGLGVVASLMGRDEVIHNRWRDSQRVSASRLRLTGARRAAYSARLPGRPTSLFSRELLLPRGTRA